MAAVIAAMLTVTAIPTSIEAFGRMRTRSHAGGAAWALALTSVLVLCALDTASSQGDVNAQDTDGHTELINAAVDGDLDAVERLLQAGADPNLADNIGEVPLHDAAFFGFTEIVDALLDADADPNVQDMYGVTPLHAAAKEGRLGAIELLLKEGADPNLMDNDGDTPLHEAAKWGQLDAIDRLLKGGADAAALNAMSEEPGDLACEYKDDGCSKEKVRQALENAADVPDDIAPPPKDKVDAGEPDATVEATPTMEGNIDELLWWAVYNGMQQQEVQKHLEAGANPNFYGSDVEPFASCNMDDSFCGVPLFIAAARNKPGLLQLLIEAGAELDHQDGNELDVYIFVNITALQASVLMNSTDGVFALLTAGADPDIPLTSSQGNQRYNIHTAVEVQNKQIVDMLILRGTNVNAPTTLGRTALYSAVNLPERRPEFVKLLLDAGADSNFQDLDGATPLHFAARNGSLDVVELLLENGADVTISDERGETPLDVACANSGTISEDCQRINDILEKAMENDEETQESTDKGGNQESTSIGGTVKCFDLTDVTERLECALNNG